jgi:Arc/MetJ-type ribon-helix-helix transcriptional regulator
MRQHAGAARSARIGVRLSSEEQHQVDAAAKTRGYANPSAFVRAAIRNELKGRAEMTGTEERIAGGFDGVSRNIFRVERGQHAIFALVDAFAKVVLTCVAEPPPDARPQATARARERYDRLIKAAGQAMSGDARTAMEDLVSHGTK